MTPGGHLHAGWDPMVRRDQDPDFIVNPRTRADEIWISNRYQCLVKYMEGDQGVMRHLSIHSLDRGPVRNWRHLQQIKNEVCGELTTAVEIFPPEDQLVDTANEYHLWVFPEEFTPGFGLGHDPLVSDDEAVEGFNDAPHRGRQEPWEPGLTTGRTEHSRPARERLRKEIRDLF